MTGTHGPTGTDVRTHHGGGDTMKTATQADPAQTAAAAAGPAAGEPRLTGHDLTLGYDQRTIARELDVAVPDRSFTSSSSAPTRAASRRCCCARSRG